MSSRHPRFGIPRPLQRRGFALIITITLLAFLVLLLVSLASLTRVETQVASNNQSIAQARQNALMALNLALGQLQRHAGPDQRITATADVIAPSGHTWTTLPVISTAANYTTARTTDKASIESKWAATTNRHWTGTWTNQIKDSDYDRDNPSASNAEPVLQSWLVSGNETSGTGDTFKPTDTVSGLTADSSPIDRLGVPGKYHRLLVKTSAGVTAAAALNRAVTAPEIEITATNIPGTDGSATPVGHYAWWVGDEGVKARVNLTDPYATTGTAQAQLTRLQTAQRPAIEAIDTALAPLDPSTQSADALEEFQASVGQVINPGQFAYIDSSATFTTALKEKYHNLTTSSRGVLADVKHGGLKADLSYLFGRPNLTDFRTALGKVYDTTFNAGDSVFAPFATLYANRPSAPAFNTTPGIFSATPTWDQLWSFTNMNAPAGLGVFSTDTSGKLQAAPRLQTSQQQGLYPLVMQCKLFYNLRIDPATQGIWVEGSVVLVLANPYNVKLAPTDYTLRLDGGSPRLRFGTTTDLSGYSATTGQISINPLLLGKTEFVVRNTEGIEAGQALVFTIDASNPGMADNRVPVSATTATKVNLSRGFDPLTAITYNTGETLPKVITIDDTPQTHTHVALLGGPSGLITKLYLDYAGAEDPAKIVQYAIGQFTASGTSGLYFIVNPISGGSRVGGGYMNILVEPPSTPGNNTSTNRVQQAVFYQTNYRALLANYSSNSPGDPHPVEWYRTYGKNGDTAPSGSLFNPWLDADHLRSAEDPAANIRWGIVNRGESPLGSPATPSTIVPASIGGASADDVGFENLLYDLPRPDRSLASLGQLQHFNPSAFLTVASYGAGSATYNSNIVHTWQVNYPISNSYPHPRVTRDNVYYHTSAFGYHFDGSYLWNDLLWDRFYFSTFPQETSASPSFDFATDKLANARYRPFRDRSTTAWDQEENFRGDGVAGTAANSRKAASNLLIDGAFNINSTSVEAWKALLSSLRHVPIGSETPSAPFVRTLYPTGGSANAPTGRDSNSFNGFRDLTPAQVNDIAEEIVLQVRKRGPFLSLSEFVNRRLITGREKTSEITADPLGLGLSGTLQSAIDRVVNQKSDVTAPLNNTSSTDLTVNSLKEIDYVMPTGMSGFPGYLLQGDVLSALGSTLSARSDTFTIRTYGDSVNPATGDVTGRAWCEAVVQRVPDYVDATPATATPAPGSDAATFGRRFQIVSFRWLSPEDI